MTSYAARRTNRDIRNRDRLMFLGTLTDHSAAHERALSEAVICPYCPDETKVHPANLTAHMAHYHADIALTPDERELYERRNREIKEGLDSLERMANALADVRDRRLYREDYPTFEAYCKGFWDKSRGWGHNLAIASYVLQTLSPFVDSALMPVREIQTRTLNSINAQTPGDAMVSEDFLAQVWLLAVNTTPNHDPKQVTASHLRDVAEVMDQALNTGGFVDADTGESEPVTPTSFKAAVLVEKVEKLARQYEHMTRKRERVLKVSPTIHKFGSQDGCETVTLKLPPGTDTAALRAAWRNGLELFVSMYTEKELS